MNIDLAEILGGYFSFEWNKHKEFDYYLKTFYENRHTKITPIVSDKVKLTARLGHVWKNPNGTYDLVEYCSDVEIIKASEKRCKPPLGFIPDCNYMYYGCYLTICAYLLGVIPNRLLLFHGPGGNDVYSYKYRPEIASIFLRNRYNSLQAVEAREKQFTALL